MSSSKLSFDSNISLNELYDLPFPIENIDYEGRSVEVFGDQRFVNCRFGNLESKDSLSLVECQAEKVSAKGNILLQNCSITGPVTAGKKIVAVNCEHKDRFFADEIEVYGPHGDIVDHKTRGDSIHNHYFSENEWTKVLKEGVTIVLDTNSSAGRDMITDKYTRTVRIKGVVKGDVRFPEDSLFPERRVILEEGGSLLGSVKNGKLIKKNMPISSGIDLDKYVESVCIKASVAEK